MTTAADELIALTGKLAAAVEQDVAVLKGGRPAALTANAEERAALAAAYAQAMAAFKGKPAIAALPAPLRQKLKTATERLHKATREQSRLLARFRHVTEGMIKAVADAVAAREASGVYGKAGYVVRPPSAPRASAMTLNQAV